MAVQQWGLEVSPRVLVMGDAELDKFERLRGAI